MTCDYETRWRILGRLLVSEMHWYDCILSRNWRSGYSKVLSWMVAIDAGIRDIERSKELKAEDDKK